LCAAALAVALVAALSAGCSGEDDGRAESDARFACLLAAEARASAGVVSRYLAQGKLGTRSEIDRAIRAMDSPGYEPVSFLTSQSKLVPLEQMTDAQRATFEDWKATDPVQNVIHRAERRAINLALEQARSTCPGGDE
jgi:hypothetical protein